MGGPISRSLTGSSNGGGDRHQQQRQRGGENRSPVDESDREGGDEQEGYGVGSSVTLTRLSPDAAAVCIDQLSYCIPILLTSMSIFQHAHALELDVQVRHGSLPVWKRSGLSIGEVTCSLEIQGAAGVHSQRARASLRCTFVPSIKNEYNALLPV
jgi:hypothetical protein